jgi:hypothetical protein
MIIHHTKRKELLKTIPTLLSFDIAAADLIKSGSIETKMSREQIEPLHLARAGDPQKRIKSTFGIAKLPIGKADGAASLVMLSHTPPTKQVPAKIHCDAGAFAHDLLGAK